MITRQRLQDWIEDYRVQLTAEAVGALLALGHDVTACPDPARRAAGMRAPCGHLRSEFLRSRVETAEGSSETAPWCPRCSIAEYEEELTLLREVARLARWLSAHDHAADRRGRLSPCVELQFLDDALVAAGEAGEQHTLVDRDVDGTRPPG